MGTSREKRLEKEKEKEKKRHLNGQLKLRFFEKRQNAIGQKFISDSRHFNIKLKSYFLLYHKN